MLLDLGSWSILISAGIFFCGIWWYGCTLISAQLETVIEPVKVYFMLFNIYKNMYIVWDDSFYFYPAVTFKLKLSSYRYIWKCAAYLSH